MNCGTCGHVCVDTNAVCTKGLCPVVPLVTGLTNPRDLAFGDAVYVTVGDLCDAGAKGCPNGELLRLAPPAAPQVFSNEFNPAGIAADLTAVYWADEDPTAGTIRKLAYTSSPPTTFAGGIQGPFVVALSTAAVFWGTAVGSYAMQAKASGNSTAVYMPPAAGGTANIPTALAVDLTGTTLFWTVGSQTDTPTASDGLVQVLTVGNSAPTTIRNNAAYPLGLVLNGTNILWSEFYGNAIYSVPVTGTQFQTLVEGTQYAQRPVRLAVDGSNLYWTTYGSMDDGAAGDAAIFKMAMPDGPITTLATAESTPGLIAPIAIVVSSQYVYWLNRGLADTANGSVMRVSK
jgi:hypothetical protein